MKKRHATDAAGPPRPSKKSCVKCVLCNGRFAPNDTFQHCQVCNDHTCFDCGTQKINKSSRSFYTAPIACCGRSIRLGTFFREINNDDLKRKYAFAYSEFVTLDRVYCPVPKCSAFISPVLLPKDYTNIREFGDAGRNFKCPYCKAAFCLACRFEAHPESHACLKARGSIDDDLAKTLKHFNVRRCIYCGQATQRTVNCYHMACLCGQEWCWGCGVDADSCKSRQSRGKCEDNYYETRSPRSRPVAALVAASVEEEAPIVPTHENTPVSDDDEEDEDVGNDADDEDEGDDDDDEDSEDSDASVDSEEGENNGGFENNEDVGDVREATFPSPSPSPSISSSVAHSGDTLSERGSDDLIDGWPGYTHDSTWSVSQCPHEWRRQIVRSDTDLRLVERRQSICDDLMDDMRNALKRRRLRLDARGPDHDRSTHPLDPRTTIVALTKAERRELRRTQPSTAAATEAARAFIRRTQDICSQCFRGVLPEIWKPNEECDYGSFVRGVVNVLNELRLQEQEDRESMPSYKFRLPELATWGCEFCHRIACEQCVEEWAPEEVEEDRDRARKWRVKRDEARQAEKADAEKRGSNKV